MDSRFFSYNTVMKNEKKSKKRSLSLHQLFIYELVSSRAVLCENSTSNFKTIVWQWTLCDCIIILFRLHSN